MALIEAVLTYRPHAIGTELSVPIGSTDDPRVVRALREALISQADAEALMWRNVDPGVFAMKHAECERLRRVLSVILPDEDVRPHLRIVPAGGGEETEPPRDPTIGPETRP